MQELNTIQSEKAIMRAISATYVNYKPEVISIVKKYTPVNEDISKPEMLNIVLRELSTNEDFAEDFVKLMVKKKTLKSTHTDYRNVVGTVIVGIVSAVGGVASKVLGNKQAELEGENLTKQKQLEAEQQMMQMIANEEENRAKKQRATTIIISISIIAMFALIGIVVYNKTRKS